MSHLQMRTVLVTLTNKLNETQQLAVAADQWVSVTFPRGVPKFSSRHKEIITELAFLQAFLAWEAFLEESFILYLLGKKPPKGNPPRRHVIPSTRKIVGKLIAEGRDYADWSAATNVIKRADRFFREGKPYAQVLKAHQNMFDEISAIRNAIAHSSAHSQEKFKNLTRNKLGIYPSNLTVGGFLAMTVPSSSPPESFLEFYLSKIRFAAQRIVPN